MSKLDELIQELCPEGVEYMQLGAIEDAGLIKLGRGSVISKKDIAAEPGDYPIYSSSASGVGEFGRYGKYMFDDERLSWSVDGGGRFFYRHPHKYSVTNVSGWLKVLDSSRIDIKYLFYALDSAWSTKKFDYTKKAHPSVIRNEYKIPLLPLEVQKEIASILDKFTQLEAELSAELDARRKQYEYYKNTLLKPDEEVSWKTIGEVCEVGDGNHSSSYPKASEMVEQGIPFIRGTNIVDGTISGKDMKYISEEKHTKLKKGHLKANDVLVTNRGEVGKIAIIPEQFSNSNLNSQIAWLRADTHILLPKYLFFIMNANFIQNKIIGEGGALKQLTIKNLKLLKIPVPPISKQEEVVEVLDNFDKLTNDKMVGIPAEIDVRRQQYEYYRTKLLTFQELSA